MQFIAASSAEQMAMFDVPMAIICVIGGVMTLSIRKQQAAARLERVKKGEMTEAVAKRRNRDLSLSGYTFIALGFGIAISHYLSK
jgi:hypothetical protein